VADLRIWKLDDLIAVLGPSIREGNDDAKGYAREENSGLVASFYLDPEKPPPPPIDGVGRWRMWDCYLFESSSETYRKFLWQCMREAAADSLQSEVTKAAVSSSRALTAMRHALCCKAATRLHTGGAADEWVLIRTCPRHSSLQYAAYGGG